MEEEFLLNGKKKTLLQKTPVTEFRIYPSRDIDIYLDIEREWDSGVKAMITSTDLFRMSRFEGVNNKPIPCSHCDGTQYFYCMS